MLNKDTWHKVSPYLDQVLDVEPDDREAWITRFGAEQPEIAEAIRELLADYAILSAKGFLEQSIEIASSITSRAGKKIGAYTIQSLIGQGGMGDVWLALRSDGRFEGRFAVKFLRSISLPGGAALQRFKQEGQLLARLAHPNIERLIDAGVTEADQPYLVLEFIEGAQIDHYCDAHELSVDDRLRLFLYVLAAVEHAHAHLIVHRDIKPSNVLVTADGVPKLLDFGVAKLMEIDPRIDALELTRDAGVALTPAYASPEQLTGGPMTTATDIYALGVLLYVLLTGRHPVGDGGRSASELVKTIVDSEPPRPSSAFLSNSPLAAKHAAERASTPEKLQKQLRRELDTIVGKSMKKDPAQRYSSVALFAQDISRHLNHEPIGARPDTLAYRGAKFVRRNRVAVGLAALVSLAIIVGLAGTLVQAHTARLQRDFAMAQLLRSQEHDEFLEFLLSNAAPQGKPFTADELLAEAESILQRQQSVSPERRVDLLLWIGTDYAQRDRNVDARRLLESAYQSTRELADHALRGRAACALADIVARDEEVDRAETLYREGLEEIPDAPRFALDRASCLRIGAEVARDRGETDAGIVRAEMALRLLVNSPLRTDAAEMYSTLDLASAYSEAGRDLDALPRFERAAQLQSALGYDETQDAVVLFTNWALELDQAGRPLEAEKLYVRIMDLSRNRQSQDAISPMILNNYARTLRELNHLPEASETVGRAYTQAVQLKNELVVNQALLERSRIYVLQHEPLRAADMLAEVEPRLKSTLPKGHYAFAAVAQSRSKIATEQGDVASAARFIDEAISILEQSIRSGGEGAFLLPALLIDRSGVNLQKHETGFAADDANRALHELRFRVPEGALSSRVGHAYLALANALNAQHQADGARAAAGKAVENLQATLGPTHPETLLAHQLVANLP
jgi:eukaryotic-like serine/threonine-protein kinase